MKFLDSSLGVAYICYWFPGVVFFSVALPLNKILELISIDAGVEYLLYFIL